MADGSVGEKYWYRSYRHVIGRELVAAAVTVAGRCVWRKSCAVGVEAIALRPSLPLAIGCRHGAGVHCRVIVSVAAAGLWRWQWQRWP